MSQLDIHGKDTLAHISHLSQHAGDRSRSGLTTIEAAQRTAWQTGLDALGRERPGSHRAPLPSSLLYAGHLGSCAGHGARVVRPRQASMGPGGCVGNAASYGSRRPPCAMGTRQVGQPEGGRSLLPAVRMRCWAILCAHPDALLRPKCWPFQGLESRICTSSRCELVLHGRECVRIRTGDHFFVISGGLGRAGLRRGVHSG